MHERHEEFCKSRNLYEYLKLLVQLRTRHLQRAMFVSDLRAVFPNNPKKLCGRILFPVFTRQGKSEFKPSKEKMVRWEDFYFDILPPVYYFFVFIFQRNSTNNFHYKKWASPSLLFNQFYFFLSPKFGLFNLKTDIWSLY